jgi:four helix bundle protein
MDEKIKSFADLETWRKGHEFVLKIYGTTKKFPGEELYGITSQLRRASFSITANIAEGFSRYHYKDKIRFYHNARGSVSEAQNFLFLAKDLFYLKENDFQNLVKLSETVLKLINGLIRSIENQK